ncbi:MAG: hydantoinase [Ignavibacteriaceae bacterium]|nr:hydantoinase [Ignavibacteriaceae bacterium]
MMRQIKIGIDVGGTFTHAVAVNIADYSIIGKSCVPTTHKAAEGVAKGVVESMLDLIRISNIHPDEVILIAHSTTQATNALLEGDIAKVGIIGLGRGFEAKLAQKQINLGNIELSPGKFLYTYFRFADTGKSSWKESVPGLIASLKDEGAEVIVASEVFGVDDTANEEFVVTEAEKLNFLSTSAGSISKLYGIRVRTRTAAINAAMMPKMLETANMTEKAVKESGINAPLMVMRSDGGIMDISEMRKRPILTMLSGPAAGVAAALMYIKVSDGVFLEVGGTSTDISVIKNGKPQIKSAQIGKNRLFLRTLDVRTLGIAGGSVPRISGNKVIDVGPRSAHIANLKYVAYHQNIDSESIEVEKVQPLKGDPSDYLALKTRLGNERFTISPTEASYQLGLVSAVGHGEGNKELIGKVFSKVASLLNSSASDLAEQILKISALKIKPVILQLVREYKLDPELIRFVGGGGGASAIVPFTGNFMNVPHQIAENCEVVSAIGAAMGIIKDSVERNIVSPNENDILSLRQEAINSVLKMGASPESIEVTIEIDNQNKKVIATAFGSSEFKTSEMDKAALDENGLAAIAAKSLRCKPEQVNIEAKNEFVGIYTYLKNKPRFMWFGGGSEKSVRVVENDGTIRLQVNDAQVNTTNKNGIKTLIGSIVAENTTFGDAGALVPDIFIVIGRKVLDLCGLITESQIVSLAEIEVRNLSENDMLIVVSSRKK